jgi:hypothetical protein
MHSRWLTSGFFGREVQIREIPRKIESATEHNKHYRTLGRVLFWACCGPIYRVPAGSTGLPSTWFGPLATAWSRTRFPSDRGDLKRRRNGRPRAGFASAVANCKRATEAGCESRSERWEDERKSIRQPSENCRAWQGGSTGAGPSTAGLGTLKRRSMFNRSANRFRPPARLRLTLDSLRSLRANDWSEDVNPAVGGHFLARRTCGRDRAPALLQQCRRRIRLRGSPHLPERRPTRRETCLRPSRPRPRPSIRRKRQAEPTESSQARVSRLGASSKRAASPDDRLATSHRDDSPCRIFASHEA